MSARDRYTAAQWQVMEMVYVDGWKSSCPHLGPVWTVDEAGLARCSLCPATWGRREQKDPGPVNQPRVLKSPFSSPGYPGKSDAFGAKPAANRLAYPPERAGNTPQFQGTSRDQLTETTRQE